MELVRDDPSARWLPSRHRFALAKVIARIVYRPAASRPLHADPLLLAIDRDQSAPENYAVCIWYCATAIVYVAAVLPLPFWLALVAAIPLTALLIEIPLYLGGNSFVMMLLMFLASAYFATTSGAAFYFACFSLLLFVTNSAAWVIKRACGI